MPVVIIPVQLAQHFWREICRRQNQARSCSKARQGRLATNDNDPDAAGGSGEEQLGKIIREPNTTDTGSVTRNLSRVNRNPSPGKSLHVGHGSVLILLRAIVSLLF